MENEVSVGPSPVPPLVVRLTAWAVLASLAFIPKADKIAEYAEKFERILQQAGVV